ncbi:MAG: GNAT family N-acetyltransferase [Bacteroidia bacterium]
MSINIQPILENDNVILYPLSESDFEALYQVASDPNIWKQHPNKDRWKREVFDGFFEGAINSKGAFKVIDKQTQTILGCTRFYDYNPEHNSILIGYTFYATAHWGKGINHAVKRLMLDYIFQFVSTVYFHIGAENLRSKIAIGRLGAIKINEQEVAYFNEPPKLNFVYVITRSQWLSVIDKTIRTDS